MKRWVVRLYCAVMYRDRGATSGTGRRYALAAWLLMLKACTERRENERAERRKRRVCGADYGGEVGGSNSINKSFAVGLRWRQRVVCKCGIG